MPRPHDPEKRAALLAAAADHVLENGLADLSLRPLAAALGTSPRMLLYHFGSKERLVAEALAASRGRQADQTQEWLAAQPDLGPAELLRRFWRWQTEEQQSFLRLFFEVYGLALQDPARFPGFLDHAVTDWLPFIGALLENAGVPKREAATTATTVIAGYRGLLLDYLATGDPVRTRKALDVLLDSLEERLAGQ